MGGATYVPPPPLDGTSIGSAANFCLRYTCCAVVTKLFVNQYSVNPLGTFNEKYPIISGMNFRIACVCCWLGSCDWGGEIIFWLAN